jgi:hypothetical protein
MSTADIVARLFALVIAFIAVAALAAYAGASAKSPQASAPVCCIYMIF